MMCLPGKQLLNKLRSKEKMKKRFVLMVLILILAVAACSPKTEVVPVEGETQDIVIGLPFIPNIQFSPLYVAIENGYFDAVGLNVTLDYRSEIDAATLVATDEIQFAIVSAEQVLLGRAQEMPLVYVLAWYQSYPVGIAALAESGITSPADLSGMKLGVPALSGASYIGMRALMDAGELNESDLTIDVVGYNQIEALTSGQEDAVVVYVANEPVQLSAMGEEVVLLSVSDHLDLLSNGLVASEKMIAENPELVSKVTAALWNAIQAVAEDPEMAYETSLKYVENLENADKNIQLNILKESIKLYQVEKGGLSDQQSWENLQQILLELELLQEPLNLDEAFRNDFVPGS
jgi:NitT/TauT family transport system substrate-binding protein